MKHFPVKHLLHLFNLVPDLVEFYMVPHDKIEIDKHSIDEALKTGLFTSRGSNRMGWAHQTYAEFLAAHYIVTHNVPFDKLKNLIFHSVDPQSKLIPQLYEVSSWLSTMSSDVFNEIVKKNPEVLLRSDLRASEEKYKEKLVIKLLDSFEKEEIYDVSGNISNNYENNKEGRKRFVSPSDSAPYLKDNVVV